ncbi:MAG: 4Fe-4S dicluster domain-containing protein [Candidatus Omnitrophota bacterium]|jgi:ferredoxin
MKKIFYKISKKDLFDLFTRLSTSHRMYVPYRKGEELYFDKFDAAKEDAMELGAIRQTQPFKSFISRSREKVADVLKEDAMPLIVAGVKGCDLKSMTLQDRVFQDGDQEDPFYVKNRKNTTIISCDCTMAKETCFCVAMDGAPYPQVHFDINLSMLGKYYLAEVASPKGEAIVEEYKTFFKEPSSGDTAERDTNRQAVTSQVKEFIANRETPAAKELNGTVKKYYNTINFWQDFTSTCVECGACNLVCPTCHCFLLFDTKGKGGAERFRIWDSCLYNTFARVAGGANPRRHLYERLRNRIDKKFAFFPETMDYYACTGCGRCIQACPGNIDIREIMKGLVKGIWNKPPNK